MLYHLHTASYTWSSHSGNLLDLRLCSQNHLFTSSITHILLILHRIWISVNIHNNNLSIISKVTAAKYPILNLYTYFHYYISAFTLQHCQMLVSTLCHSLPLKILFLYIYIYILNHISFTLSFTFHIPKFMQFYYKSISSWSNINLSNFIAKVPVLS